MRITLLCAGTALTISLVLTACSSSGNVPAISGSSQSATTSLGHGESGHLIPVGIRNGRLTNYLGQCPGILGSSPYYENYCYFVTAGTSFSQGWQETYTGGGPLPGNWHWRSCHSYRVKNGRSYRYIRCSWGPNPANPNSQTVTVDASVSSTPSSGPPQYYVTIKACSNNSPYGNGYCDGPYEIGVMVEPSSK